MRSLYAILILAIVTPGPLSMAYAQDNKDIVVKANPQPKKAKRVCKNFDAPTGSRVGSSRVCRTEAEWRLAEDSAQRTFEQQELRFRAERAQFENEKNGLPVPRAH